MTEQITGTEKTFVGLFEGLDGSEAGRALRAIRKVEIPLVQRDYAQGRSDDKVKDIRVSFLDSIYTAIVEGSHLSLDFVYGGVTNSVLRPLDGQQRLTTLFLLHWYLANRSGAADPEAPWGRFTYDTRPSARRFCELLMQSPPPESEDWDRLSAWLADQPWYLYVWEQDPTIASMLVMLDAIHDRFGELDADFAWRRLTDPVQPAVSFFVLPIEEIGAGDELYIKMNSRGKPLTDFETFKARFEQAIQPPERSTLIAHKLDGAWADVLWPIHGGDNIVDDEFLRYIEFLVDVGEWRAGLVTEGRLLDRAARLVGGGSTRALDALDFFERAFDTWGSGAIDEFFEGVFRGPGPRAGDDDLRPVLFTPEGLDGVNLFELCCHHYGSMRGERARAFPLGLTIMLYGVLVHRLEGTDNPLARLRVLRNLVESSENEIRAERMPEHLAEVEVLMRTGDVEGIRSFNQIQVTDEIRKADFLGQHPEAVPAVALLEDHRLLRGTLAAIELDPSTIEQRAEAFTAIFSDNTHWATLTGALLACGDYYRRRNDHRFLFGSPSTDSSWRSLLAGPARTPLEEVQEPLGRLLDEVAGCDGSSVAAFEHVTAQRIEQSERTNHYDWRYYLVKYPEMREGTSGIFVTASGEMGYEVCALKRTALNSYYRDPYLLAIYRSLGVDRFWLEDPWFTGLAHLPRWLRLRRAEVAVRSVERGLEFAVPPELMSNVGEILRSVEEVEVNPDGLFWSAPQHIVAGKQVDAVDRVQVGRRMLERVLSDMPPQLLRDDIFTEIDVRGHQLATRIADLLRDADNLRRSWVWVPRDRSGNWCAFELADGRCIELILRPDDKTRVSLVVKAYPSYGKTGNLFQGFDHAPLGVSWPAPDREIAEAFLKQVVNLQERLSRS